MDACGAYIHIPSESQIERSVSSHRLFSSKVLRLVPAARPKPATRVFFFFFFFLFLLATGSLSRCQPVTVSRGERGRGDWESRGSGRGGMDAGDEGCAAAKAECAAHRIDQLIPLRCGTLRGVGGRLASVQLLFVSPYPRSPCVFTHIRAVSLADNGTRVNITQPLPHSRLAASPIVVFSLGDSALPSRRGVRTIVVGPLPGCSFPLAAPSSSPASQRHRFRSVSPSTTLGRASSSLRSSLSFKPVQVPEISFAFPPVSPAHHSHVDVSHWLQWELAFVGRPVPPRLVDA